MSPIQRVISKGTAFIAIFLVLVLSLDALFMWSLRNLKRGDFGVWNKLVGGEINADILFTGSSRTLVHFDCTAVISILHDKSCFNLGLDASAINFQLPYLRTYLDHNRDPGVIVQGLSVSSLHSTEYIFAPEQYIPYLDNEIMYRHLLSVDDTFWRHKYLPLYSFALYGTSLRKNILASLFGLKFNYERPNGFRAEDQEWTSAFDRFKQANPDGITYTIEQPAIQNLRILIELAKSQNSDVLLVYTPEYYENYELTLNRDEILDIYRAVAAEYDIEFWDYSDTPITHDKRYFYNSQHLNREGAREFSTMFAHDLSEYLEQKSISDKPLPSESKSRYDEI